MHKLTVPIVLPDTTISEPRCKHPGHDAGYDLCSTKDIILWPFKVVKIPVNAQISIPQGFFARITGRSGLSVNGILTIPGTVDSGYIGVIHAITMNLSFWPKKIRRGDRIAQMIVMPCASLDFRLVNRHEETDRGSHGFMSTGLT